MHSLHRLALATLMSPLLLCAACDSRKQPPPVRPSPAEDDPFVKPVPAAVEEPAEPDWRARYESHKRGLASSFAPPKIGNTLAIKLKSGTEREGTLTALSENEVTLAFEVGEVSYPRAGLSVRTRSKLFADDYAHVRATERVKRERENHRRKNQPGQTTASTTDLNSGAPVNDPTDQSVWQVKEFLAETLKDPHSIRYKEWSPVMKTDKGYQVVCTYQARAGSFGMVTEKKVFHMTESGRVTTASAVRRNLE